jgi:hypothetical protein
LPKVRRRHRHLDLRRVPGRHVDGTETDQPARRPLDRAVQAVGVDLDDVPAGPVSGVVHPGGHQVPIRPDHLSRCLIATGQLGQPERSSSSLTVTEAL